MNLIETWRESIKEKGVTLAKAVEQMNAFTRLSTLPQHLHEMQHGKRDISVKVHNYILNEVFFYLSDSGLTIMEIKEYLLLPERVK